MGLDGKFGDELFYILLALLPLCSACKMSPVFSPSVQHLHMRNENRLCASIAFCSLSIKRLSKQN